MVYPLEHRNLSLVWDIDGLDLEIKECFDLCVAEDNFLGILEHYCNAFFNNLRPELIPKAENFIFEYLQENYNNTNKVNAIVDIARHSQKQLFEKVLLAYIELNQDAKAFAEIWWRGNGGSYVGEVNMGDIEAAEWKNIYSIIEKSSVIPIKQYINKMVESALNHGDWERKRKFLGY